MSGQKKAAITGTVSFHIRHVTPWVGEVAGNACRVSFSTEYPSLALDLYFVDLQRVKELRDLLTRHIDRTERP